MDNFGHGGFIRTYLAADYLANPYWLPMIDRWAKVYRRSPLDRFR